MQGDFFERPLEVIRERGVWPTFRATLGSDHRRDREFLAGDVILREHAVGLREFVSKWTIALASNPPICHPRPKVRPLADACSSTFRDPPARRLCQENSPPPPTASWSAASSRRTWRAKGQPAEPRPPSCESAAAKEHRQDPQPRL